MQEHDGSRRMKTELLIQMDGVIASPEQVGATAPGAQRASGEGAALGRAGRGHWWHVGPRRTRL